MTRKSKGPPNAEKTINILIKVSLDKCEGVFIEPEPIRIEGFVMSSTDPSEKSKLERHRKEVSIKSKRKIDHPQARIKACFATTKLMHAIEVITNTSLIKGAIESEDISSSKKCANKCKSRESHEATLKTNSHKIGLIRSHHNSKTSTR